MPTNASATAAGADPSLPPGQRLGARRRTYGPALENEVERTLFEGFEPSNSCGVVRCLAHGFPTILNRWHYHPEYELHLITATHGRAYVGDYVGTYQPGHLVLAGPGLPHNWLVDDLPPGGIQAPIHKVLQFRDETLRDAAKVFDAMEEIFPMLENARYGIEFFGAAEMAEHRFDAIKASTGLQRVAAFLDYLSELARWSDIRLLSEAQVEGSMDAYSRQASDIIRYVVANAYDDLAMSEVAQHFGMSDKYFSKLFKRSTGNTFVDFVVRLRLNKACQLLATSDLYVGTICERVGFNNVANFNRHFIKAKGMTPTAFRQKSSERFAEPYL
jgi:AraC-like DNA-binding protein